MPQEGSGSAAPMDPAAIEAVRATSSSRKQPLASPERPVTPYDRHVVSHDASRPSPSSRSPLALEPSEGGETSPHRRGASSSAMRGGMASCGAAHLAVMAHGDAWPPPLEGERARDPSLGEGAETEKEAFSRRRVDEGDDASAVVYGLDGTVSTVRVPPVLSPGSVSYAPRDRVLQGPGSRLGAEKRALPGGRLRGSLPLTGEPRPRVDGLATTNSRPGTREGGRVTASEVFNAITGARVTVVADAARAGDSGEATESATREKASEAEDAFPERSGPFALRASLDGSASSVSESDDEPVETLAIARERARHEERVRAEKAAVADASRETRAEGDGDETPPPPPPRPEPGFLDFAANAPRLRMATFASGPAPRPVSREAGRTPPRSMTLPKEEASPPKPPRVAPAETARGPAAASAEPKEPKRETTRAAVSAADALASDETSPLDQALEAWGVSLPDSPSAMTKRAAAGGDLVAVDDEDDDLLAAFGAAAEAAGTGAPGRASSRDAIPASPFATSPPALVSSPLGSPLGGARGETPREFPPEREEDPSPPRDCHSGSSADENAPDPRGAVSVSVSSGARETAGFAGFANADDARPSLARFGRATRDAETKKTTRAAAGSAARVLGGPPSGPERVAGVAGVLRETRRASSARGNAENARETETRGSGSWSLRVDGATDAAAKMETTSRVGASRPEALVLPGDASETRPAVPSSPGTRDPGGGERGGASPRGTSPREETFAAHGVGNATRSRSRRRSRIPPPPSSLLVRSGSEVAEAERAETALGAASARRSARRLANPKSRLPPPPTRRDAETPEAPNGETASRATATRSTGSAKTTGVRIASTTAAGYSAGAAAGKGKAEKRPTKPTKPTKPKPAASQRLTKPAARLASTASDDAGYAPRDAHDAERTPRFVPAEPVASHAPAPSATPAKLKKGALASAPPPMTKAEEARARLRGSRQRRSIAGVASSISASRSSGVSSAASSAAPPAAAQAPPRPAGAPERGSDPAAAAAAAKLASKLGSVSVMKPRGSTSSKEGAAEKAEKRAADAARRAEHAAAFAKAAAEAEAAKAAAAKAAKEAAAREAEHRVAGVDEAEMVLRVGSLADEKTLAGARQAVHRMRALLDDVTRLSRELKCEPQHVYGHVLHRLGFPTDRESRETPLERAVGAERAREMCAGVSELRNLLRIKVQDNNDLRLAQTALCETSAFFERLDAFAAKKNKTPSEVLAAQAGGGVA